MKNQLKRKIKEGRTVLGTLVFIPSPAVIEVLGRAGFDFAVIDTEHTTISPYETAMIENMIRAAELSGITPIVRIPEPSKVMTQKVLDAGAQGVMVSGIKNKSDALKIVRDAKFPPRGERGCCSVTRPTGYSADYSEAYWEEANNEIMVIPLIETQEGVDNLEEILTVEGIDWVSFGPRDYTMSIGYTDVNNPKTLKASEHVTAVCKKHGVLVDQFVFPPYDVAVKQARDRGFNVLTAGIDLSILLGALRTISMALKNMK